MVKLVHLLAVWQLHGPPATTPERGSAEHGCENEAKLGTAAISCGRVRDAETLFHRDKAWPLAVVIRQVCNPASCPFGPCDVDSANIEPTAGQIATLYGRDEARGLNKTIAPFARATLLHSIQSRFTR